MSKSSPNLSSQSLDEFQEFDRLIRENTAPDSDEEEQDSALSNAVTRNQSTTHGDAEYQSIRQSATGQETLLSTDIEERSRLSDSGSLSTSSRSHSSLRRTHLAFDSDSPRENDGDDVTNKFASRQGFMLDRNLTMNDNNAPIVENLTAKDESKLVATFGTTENLEALLKQQLDKTGEDGSENGTTTCIDDQALQQVVGLASFAPQNQNIQLPYQRRSLQSRTTQSPAANRAKKTNKSKPQSSRSYSPGFPENIDDFSVCSDASRNELRQRLRKLRADRKKEQTMTEQLRNDYDDALTEFNKAENVIDQLRVGAKIDLLAQIPSGNEKQRMEESQKGLRSPASSQKATESTSRASQDHMTENSLKLPTTASTEFLRIALEHQATELNDHIRSFNELMNGGHIEDKEMRQVVDSIVVALNKLQADYVSAGKEHEAEKRRVILSGDAKGVDIEDFDTGCKIQEQIFKLGKIVEDLKENIRVGPSLPETPASSRRFFNPEWCDSDDLSDSSLDIDDDFKEQLRRYKKYSVASDAEGRTTASGRFLLSDEDNVNHPDRKASNTGSIMPKHLFRSQSASDTSRSKITTLPVPSNIGASPVKSSCSPLKSDSLFPKSAYQNTHRCRPKSRLPKPVVRLGRKKTLSDSGFIGSESSHQSLTLSQKHGLQGRNKMPSVRSAICTMSPQPAPRHTSRPTPSESKRAEDSSQSTSANKRYSASSFYKGEVCSDQSVSDEVVSEVEDSPNTIRENRTLKSDDDSTWSTASKSMPTFTNQTIPHGAGDSVFASTPFCDTSYQRDLSLAEKQGTDSRRSLASSMKENTFDLLREEIAQLRKELREKMPPSEAFQKSTVSDFSEARVDSDSRATESQSTRGRRSRQKCQKRHGDSASVPSTRAMQLESSKHRCSENSHNGDQAQGSEEDHTTKRDAKTGGDTPITVSLRNDSNVLRGNFKSNPTYFSPSHLSMYHYGTVPSMYSSVFVRTPILKTEPSCYGPARSYVISTARIYIPVPLSISEAYKSIPVKTRMPRDMKSIRLSSATLKQPPLADENEQFLSKHRSVPFKHSPSIPTLSRNVLDSQLRVSLERAERMTDSMRQKSRAMYTSFRESFNRTDFNRSVLP